jgi:hypothetical protein
MPTRLTRGTALLGGVALGGTTLRRIAAGSLAVNPPSIAANSRAGVDVPLSGVDVGDIVVLAPPAALADDLLFTGASVTAADTVTLYLYNPTGSAIDDAQRSWAYVWFDLT